MNAKDPHKTVVFYCTVTKARHSLKEKRSSKNSSNKKPCEETPTGQGKEGWYADDGSTSVIG